MVIRGATSVTLTCWWGEVGASSSRRGGCCIAIIITTAVIFHKLVFREEKGRWDCTTTALLHPIQGGDQRRLLLSHLFSQNFVGLRHSSLQIINTQLQKLAPPLPRNSFGDILAGGGGGGGDNLDPSLRGWNILVGDPNLSPLV